MRALVPLLLVLGACEPATDPCAVNAPLAAPAWICVDRASVEFWPETSARGTPLGQARLATLSVRNAGHQRLALARLNLTGDPAIAFADDPPGAVDPGQSAPVALEFRPDRVGLVMATLVIDSNAHNQQLVTVPVFACGQGADGGCQPDGG